MISYLGSLVQSCCGEGGALQADVAVWGALAVFWLGSQRLGTLSPGAARLFPPWRAAQAARGLAARCLAPSSPPRPQRPPPVGSQEVFRQDPGPVCRVGGGGFSGSEFAPCPSPCLLPPAGMGRLFSGVSQSLCFANRQRCVPAG